MPRVPYVERRGREVSWEGGTRVKRGIQAVVVNQSAERASWSLCGLERLKWRLDL